VISSTTKKRSFDQSTLIEKLLDLLVVLIDDADATSERGSCESLVELIGLLGTGGVAVSELKALLSLVAHGPHWQAVLTANDSKDGAQKNVSSSATLLALRHPIIKALITMATHFEEGHLKARPSSLWSMSGKDSGLDLEPINWPFSGEYAVCSWVRLHKIPEGKSFLWHFATVGGAGMSTFLRPTKHGAELVVHASEEEGDNDGDDGKWAVPGVQLTPGVWYHVAVRHGAENSGSSKGRMGWLGVPSLFQKDQLTVYIDGVLKLQVETPVPRNFKKVTEGKLIRSSIGLDFNGQLGTVYVFKDAVPLSIICKLMDTSSGVMVASSQSGLGSGTHSTAGGAGFGKIVVPPDIDPSFDPGRRDLTERLLAVYSPDRTCPAKVEPFGPCQMALEVHTSYHALLVGKTFAWSFLGNDASDVIGSLGGIKCLFPLLSPLFTHTTSGEKSRRKATLHHEYDVNLMVSANDLETAGDVSSDVTSEPSSSGVLEDVQEIEDFDAAAEVRK
jgi:hypothetical protein